MTLVRNPRYWGPHAAYLDRIVIRFCRTCRKAPPAGEVDSSDSGRARSTSRSPATRASSPTSGEPRHHGSSHGRRMAGSTSTSGSAPVVTRRCRTSSSGGRWPTGSTGSPSHRRLFGGDRPAASRRATAPSSSNTSRYYRPNWSGYRYRPDAARRLLEQAGCRRGADGIYSCAGERLSLRFATAAAVDAGAHVELVQAQLRQAGSRYPVSALVGFGRSSGGDFDVALFAWFVRRRTIGVKDSRLRRRPQLHGLLREAGHARPRPGDRILDAEQRARVLNRVDAQLAKDVPAIPLFQTAGRRTPSRRPCVASIRGAVRSFHGTRRTGGSREPR